jgi:anti-sigma factor RsiW
MISDEYLLLYYYRDGLDDEASGRIDAAIAKDPHLAQRLHHLVKRLDASAAISEVPVPAAIQQRWRAALEQVANAQTPHPTRLDHTES